jgi:hypothetical protein
VAEIIVPIPTRRSASRTMHSKQAENNLLQSLVCEMQATKIHVSASYLIVNLSVLSMDADAKSHICAKYPT